MSDIQAPQPAPTPQPAPAKASNGLATAGFVLGLIGFLGSFIPVINVVGIVIGVVGAILAAVGLVKSKKVGAGQGLAMAGLILGVLALIIGIVVNVAFASAVSSSVDDVTGEVPANTTDDAAADDATTDAAAAEHAGAGTSRSIPAPLGSAITDGDWTVTINSVTTANEDTRGQTPEAGSTLLVINMTATYNATDEQGETAWVSVEFVSAEGTTFDSLGGSSYLSADDGFDVLTTLHEGGSVTGNQMIEVPTDGWQDGVLKVSPTLFSFSDDVFVAVQ
jgi:hypothetical protein